MEASYEGGQGPEGAVAPYMDGLDVTIFVGLANCEHLELRRK